MALIRAEVGGRRLYSASRSARGARLRFHGAADFDIDTGAGSVCCHPDPTASDELLELLVAGTLAATILELRGHLSLHASAVLLDGHVTAFVGASGMGKSTMAGWLCSAGGELLADDVLRVDCERDEVWAHAGSTEARLRTGARVLADRFDDAAGRRETIDGRLALAPRLASADRLPLGRIVLPCPSRTATRVQVTRLRPTQAVLALTACPRVQGWADPAVLQAQFDRHATLAARVPVFAAVVPWGPPFDASVPRQLVAMLAEGAPSP